MKTTVIQLLIKDVDVFAEISQLHYHDVQNKDGQVGFYRSTTLPNQSVTIATGIHQYQQHRQTGTELQIERGSRTDRQTRKVIL